MTKRSKAIFAALSLLLLAGICALLLISTQANLIITMLPIVHMTCLIKYYLAQHCTYFMNN